MAHLSRFQCRSVYFLPAPVLFQVFCDLQGDSSSRLHAYMFKWSSMSGPKGGNWEIILGVLQYEQGTGHWEQERLSASRSCWGHIFNGNNVIPSGHSAFNRAAENGSFLSVCVHCSHTERSVWSNSHSITCQSSSKFFCVFFRSLIQARSATRLCCQLSLSLVVCFLEKNGMQYSY